LGSTARGVFNHHLIGDQPIAHRQRSRLGPPCESRGGRDRGGGGLSRIRPHTAVPSAVRFNVQAGGQSTPCSCSAARRGLHMHHAAACGKCENLLSY
jgi:hypothetical protein